VIGYGAPGVEGTPDAHGSPLGAQRLAAARVRFGWPDEPFHVPDDVRLRCRELAADGAARHRAWRDAVAARTARNPAAAARWRDVLGGPIEQGNRLPQEVEDALAGVPTGRAVATRQASAAVLAALGPVLPDLVGGSADLAGSTGVAARGGGTVHRADYGGPNVAFGVREHAMAAMLNGIALHGGLRPFGSTFLVFSDYLRPALRMSALMRLPVIYVFTHDSVTVGEDGPTHQPVEQLESLRLIPGLLVLRPADDAETVAAWRSALLHRDGPTALVLSRQSLPPLGPLGLAAVDALGARRIGPAVADPLVTILASGSEVQLAVEAAAALTRESVPTRVVSVPCRERFTALDDAHRRSLLGRPDVVAAVEAGVPSGWAAVTGDRRNVLGIETFGCSGPGDQVRAHLGLTGDRLTALVHDALRRCRDA
jgi:transketolase